MSEMYPNNQDIEIFGEQVSWPGVDANGKFTNGSFSDPMVKPSFIPAETINLVLDNLSSIIKKCGGTPNATGASQIADLVTHLATGRSILMRDEHGRAKVAAPQEPDDIARLAEIEAVSERARNSLEGYGLHREGRNLLNVLDVTNVSDVMANLRQRLNNGANEANGEPDPEGLEFGDYIDGLSLLSGSVNIPWNATYKNTRLVLSGLNQYKGAGDSENKKNHFLFTFRHCLLTQQMKSSNDNSGGYGATAIRTFLEGDMKSAIINAIGNYIYPVNRLLSVKGSWGWETDSVFLPTEREVLGTCVCGEQTYDGGFQGQFPIFQKSAEYLIKRLNGSRQWYWLASPHSGSSSSFCNITSDGHASPASASSVGGVAPAFCVA